MICNENGNEWWDVFIGNHFVCRVAASSKTEAIETGLRLHGRYLDGILNVRPRGQDQVDAITQNLMDQIERLQDPS